MKTQLEFGEGPPGGKLKIPNNLSLEMEFSPRMAFRKEQQDYLHLHAGDISLFIFFFSSSFCYLFPFPPLTSFKGRIMLVEKWISELLSISLKPHNLLESLRVCFLSFPFFLSFFSIFLSFFRSFLRLSHI